MSYLNVLRHELILLYFDVILVDPKELVLELMYDFSNVFIKKFHDFTFNLIAGRVLLLNK